MFFCFPGYILPHGGHLKFACSSISFCGGSWMGLPCTSFQFCEVFVLKWGLGSYSLGSYTKRVCIGPRGENTRRSCRAGDGHGDRGFLGNKPSGRRIPAFGFDLFFLVYGVLAVFFVSLKLSLPFPAFFYQFQCFCSCSSTCRSYDFLFSISHTFCVIIVTICLFLWSSPPPVPRAGRSQTASPRTRLLGGPGGRDGAALGS